MRFFHPVAKDGKDQESDQKEISVSGSSKYLKNSVRWEFRDFISLVYIFSYCKFYFSIMMHAFSFTRE